MATHDDGKMVVSRTVMIEDIRHAEIGYQRFSIDGKLYEWRYINSGYRVDNFNTLILESVYQGNHNS